MIASPEPDVGERLADLERQYVLLADHIKFIYATMQAASAVMGIATRPALSAVR